MDILALITARGGSKGIPGKNIKPLAGKPLIAWTIETALASRSLARVIVSTDDTEIAEVSREWGAEIPFLRPVELAQDASSHISVVEHALQWVETNDHWLPDYVLLLQPTSPFRMVEDIDGAIEVARQKDANAVLGVCPAHNHPYLTKRILDDGTLADFISVDMAYMRRQDLLPAYVINGAIYLNKSSSLLQQRSFFPPGALPYIMLPERSMDIDTPWDFYLADLILRNRRDAEYLTT